MKKEKEREREREKRCGIVRSSTNSAASRIPSTIPPTKAAQFRPDFGGGEMNLLTGVSLSDIKSKHNFK
jgi:hypothetical protein